LKRSGRDESIQVVTELSMKAMLGISLYSYPYLNKEKRFVFLIMLMSSTKWRKGQSRFCLEARGCGGKGGLAVRAGERNGPNNVCTCE
jgi:hypothetical protein